MLGTEIAPVIAYIQGPLLIHPVIELRCRILVANPRGQAKPRFDPTINYDLLTAHGSIVAGTGAYYGMSVELHK